MRQLTLDLAERSCTIYIGDQLLADSQLLESYCQGEKVLILSNKTIAPLYINEVKKSLKNKLVDQYLIDDGEVHKNLHNFSKILDFLINKKFRRNDTLIALGGGVIGDLGGFVAACYQRGMGLIQMPTSLLAQVDSSVGGKTAVNHSLGKNLIGSFYQPLAVIIDTLTLKTLPEREFKSGLAEIAKYAILGDSEIKQILTTQVVNILNREQSVLAELIYLSCRKKAQVVVQDEKEQGCRALLNLGHSFGHAIEKVTAYNEYLHGEAVSIGIHMAINLALARQYIDNETALEYKQLLNHLDLPEKTYSKLSAEDILDAMRLDKKNNDDKFRLVLPTNTSCSIVVEDGQELIKSAIIKQVK